MYKVLYAASTDEMEDKINDAAQDGWRLVTLSFVPNTPHREIVAAMEQPRVRDEYEPVRYKDVPAPSSA